MTEGLAAFFEPSAHGHLRETGAVHWRRWDRLAKAYADGRRIGLVDLLTKDRLLREAAGSALAYDEAWSLVHFLAKRSPARWVAYLRGLGGGRGQTGSRARVRALESAFATRSRARPRPRPSRRLTMRRAAGYTVPDPPGRSRCP